MLVISRKVGEKLYIGDDITITITKNGRNRVTIGIDAPNEVRVLRAEVAEADAEEQTLPFRALSHDTSSSPRTTVATAR